MRFLIRTLSLRHFRLHPLRTALTCFGIVLGTAISVGVGLMNESTLAAFGEMVEGVAGKTDITVTSASRGGMSVDALDEVLDTDGVKAAAPSVRVPALMTKMPEESVLVLGIDALAAKDFQSLPGGEDFDALAFLNRPDAVLVPVALAERHGIETGDSIEVTIHGNVVSLEVAAIVATEGAAKVYGGNVLIVDLFAAEPWLGRDGRIDQIDVLRESDVPLAELESSLAGRLGDRVVVKQEERNAQADSMVASLRQAVTMMSGMAIFVGMFLIYNTFATAVAQRRKEIGILRALGSTQRQVVLTFLGEATVIGILGSIIGVLMGVGLADLLVGQYAKAIDSIYFRVSTDQIVVSWPVLFRSVTIGTLAAIVAAWAPASQAARINPVEALSATQADDSNRRLYSVLFGIGLVTLLVVVVFLHLAPNATNAQTGVVAAVLSFGALTLLSPWLVGVLCSGLRYPARMLPGVEPRLGGDNLTRNTGRTAVTVTALTVGITLAVTMSGSFASVAKSVNDWISGSLAIDLSIRGSAAMPGPNSIELPMELADEIAAVPGVADVTTFRMAPVESSIGTIQLISFNVDPLTRHSFLTWTDGEAEAGYAGMKDGSHALISENLAARHNIRLGDTVTIQTPQGPREFKVGGAIIDYTSDLGTFMINRETYVALFNDTHVDAFDVWVEEGLAPAEVRTRIKEALPNRSLFIQTNREFRDEVNTAVSQIFGLTDLVQLLVIVIALIGVFNTMLISILDRRREIGMMRAIGFTQDQIRRLVLWESAFIGLVAGVLGTGGGYVFSMYVFPLVRRQLLGWTMEGIVPTQSLVIGFLVALASAVAAGVYPAGEAVKTKMSEALVHE